MEKNDKEANLEGELDAGAKGGKAMGGVEESGRSLVSNLGEMEEEITGEVDEFYISENQKRDL